MKGSPPSLFLALALLGLGVAEGCITAPDLVVVDRMTVLEQQASGEFQPLENDLQAAALRPHPEPFTRGQLEEAGWNVQAGSVQHILAIYSAVRSDEGQLDDLLIRRCIGEARDGQLVSTVKTCVGVTTPESVRKLLQRANRNRQQIWRYLEAQQPDADPTRLRQGWRKHHMMKVVCGANIERQDGSWSPKQC